MRMLLLCCVSWRTRSLCRAQVYVYYQLNSYYQNYRRCAPLRRQTQTCCCYLIVSAGSSVQPHVLCQ